MVPLMARLLTILSLAAVLAVCAGSRAWAGSAQTLGIDVSAAQPRVEQLDRYTSGQPIDVRVMAGAARGAALVGVAPNGADLRVPLARCGDGAYAGTFTPGTPGTWSLAVSIDAAGSANASSSFPIVVAEPGASEATAAVMIALAIASIGGGIGLIGIGRRNAAATAHA